MRPESLALWNNRRSEAAQGGNPERPLTRLLDCTERGLAMKATSDRATCSIDGCENPHLARGWCGTHYTRWRRTGDPGGVEDLRRRPKTSCAVDGCDAIARSRGWCSTHYWRWRVHGDPSYKVVGERPVRRLPDHPLAPPSGVIRVSRIVFFEKSGGVCPPCEWCGVELTWETVCVDHLNSNTSDNRPDNLVASCRGCNANREDGTGYGRRHPRTCECCGTLFLPDRTTARFCTVSCAARSHPKRPSTRRHGTRSMYQAGCRCAECRTENSRAWREWDRRRRGVA